MRFALGRSSAAQRKYQGELLTDASTKEKEKEWRS